MIDAAENLVVPTAQGPKPKARRLWLLALRAGVGLKTVSERAGLGRNTVSMIALGHRRGTADVWRRIERAMRDLGVTESIEQMGLPLSADEAACCRLMAGRMRSLRASVRVESLRRIAAAELWRPEKRKAVETMLDQRALAHFALTADPFREPEDRSDTWVGRQQRMVESMVIEAAQRREMLSVSGPVGSGKTVAVRRAVEQLEGSDRYAVCHVQAVAVERVTARTLLEALLLTLEGSKAVVPSGHERLSRRVIETMHSHIEQGVSPVLVVEEAHALPASALSPLKRIWERTGKGYRAGCGVCLVGQWPELGNKLSLPSVRELRQRMTTVDVLPLNAVDRDGRRILSETGDYLAWCLARRGKSPRKFLDDRAVAALDEHYKGRLTPLWLRSVVSHAMTLAWQTGQPRVTAEIMHQAMGSIPEPEGENGGL